MHCNRTNGLPLTGQKTRTACQNHLSYERFSDAPKIILEPLIFQSARILGKFPCGTIWYNANLIRKNKTVANCGDPKKKNHYLVTTSGAQRDRLLRQICNSFVRGHSRSTTIGRHRNLKRRLGLAADGLDCASMVAASSPSGRLRVVASPAGVTGGGRPARMAAGIPGLVPAMSDAAAAQVGFGPQRQGSQLKVCALG
jgi:hypothetical protein